MRRKDLRVFASHSRRQNFVGLNRVARGGRFSSGAAFGRAVVVGERSFGKSSVQQLIHLTEHHAAIKLTTAYYRLPDGRIVHRRRTNSDNTTWGVIPDIEVTLDHDEVHAIQASRRALDFAFADPPLTAHCNDDTTAPLGLTAKPSTSEIILDRQLRQALEHVRQELQEHGL